MPGPNADTCVAPQHLEFRRPVVADGASMWRIARDSRTLDVNSPYAYLLWCRDFDTTSIVADLDGRVVGYVTGYLRPAQPDTLLIWQVAVDEAQRGQRLAGRMLAALVDGLAGKSVCRMETTITPDNAASVALFCSFARSRHSEIERETLFDADDFPDGHDAEVLFRIGPWRS